MLPQAKKRASESSNSKKSCVAHAARHTREKGEKSYANAKG
jgi:hypothetical protein